MDRTEASGASVWGSIPYWDAFLCTLFCTLTGNKMVMKLKLLSYFRHNNEDSFDVKLLVIINIISFILAFFSIITSEILSANNTPLPRSNLISLDFISIFWCMVLILTITLAELALHQEYFQLSRKLSLFIYTFVLIPVGLYISGSLTIIAMYYILAIFLLNIIATTRERFIINPFFLVLIYAFIIISHQYPEYLPAPPSERILFLHWLVDAPVVILTTALLTAVTTETYRQENKKLREQNIRLEQLMRTDNLTGLYNKTYLNEQLPILLNKAHDSKTPLCIFIIDIDYFKNYNDLYGNIKGDSCLIEVANILKRNCSHITDSIFRFGGEEFILILPDTDQDGARILAESILEDFHQKKIDHYRSMICNYVTVSIGIHYYSGINKATPDDVIKNADNALYTVKSKGRNDYCININ